MMKTVAYHKAIFLKSVAHISQLPKDIGKEVAFIGRSNVGKSSALNALTKQKKLAKTSKTPGRTQCINFFGLNDDYRLVDLPGFGYAKAPKTLKDNWQQLLDQYLRSRKSLCGLILLMDIRHPLREFEIQMAHWALSIELPIHILLTKADKLSKGAQATVLQKIQNTIAKMDKDITLSLFSAKKNIGLDRLQEKLDGWFYNS